MVAPLTLGILALSLSSFAGAAQAPGGPVIDDVAVQTLAGDEVRMGAYRGDGMLVIAYTGVGCPIAGKYAGRLQRLSEAYAARGVAFVGVNANPQDSRSDVEAELRELGIEFTVLKDFRQGLTRRLGAATTTETFVFDADGQLRYRGPVDDQYSLGASRPAPTVNYLIDALEAVLAGREPKVTELAAPGCKLSLLPEAELPEAVTWSRHIAPLVQENCQQCHRPGQVGPFALETYEQARGWADMIYEVVEQERMPPWNASDVFDGVFANERGLTEDEKELVYAWVEDGMPRGEPEQDPAPANWPEGWTIGEPDAVFEFEELMAGGEPVPDEGFPVPREGVVDYQYFTVATGFEQDRWVRALEVRPGAADVVHHVLIMLRGADGDLDFRSYLAVAVPGDTPSVYPEGYGKRVPAGAELVFQLHYTPNGKERYDRSSLAMIFCDEPPEYEVVTKAVVNDSFSIPPGAENHEVRGYGEIQHDTALVALFPHMHTRGHDFQYTARYPDGSSEELLYSYYDFNWQESYLFKQAKPVPAGTRIECVGHFDNSANNPNNPDPDVAVGWGEQTFEEMFIGYYDVVRRRE